MAYQKAILCTYDPVKKKDGCDRMSVQFNPETYSIAYEGSVDTKNDCISGSTRNFVFQQVEYAPSTLSVELLFDSYCHGAVKQTDVRKDFAILRKCLEVNPEKHTAMALKFAWNAVIFVGALASLTENYTMFADDGTPVRAKLVLQIKGCPVRQLVGTPNESPDRTKLRTVLQRDTLWGLAEREYGSAEEWRTIALANGIENPRKLMAAQELVLPALGGRGG